MRRYGEVLRVPHVAALVAATLLARFPIGINALAVILYLRERTGSFAVACATEPELNARAVPRNCIAIAFTALFPERTVAACADVAFAKPDLYRRTLFRIWRRMAESMPWDDFSDHVTTQAVGARFMESPEGESIFQLVHDIVALNDPYTVRQACLAMEEMDLSELVPRVSRPLLMTNGTHDVLCPPDLAPSGLGARRMAELNDRITLVEFPDIGHADLVECPEEAPTQRP